jgi:nucleotide-binding universal stress UspA family protein
MQQHVRFNAPVESDSVAPSVYLVGVDASPDARQTVLAASALARLTGAHLVLVHIVAQRERCSPADLTNAETALRQARRLAGDTVVQSELHCSDPAEVICARAREVGAALVIVGSGFAETSEVVGPSGVSRALVEQSPCSVVVVTSRGGSTRGD